MTELPTIRETGGVVGDPRKGEGAGTGVLVGLYERQSGARLAAYDDSGARLADDALRLVVDAP